MFIPCNIVLEPSILERSEILLWGKGNLVIEENILEPLQGNQKNSSEEHPQNLLMVFIIYISHFMYKCTYYVISVGEFLG
jgi:hypothetical protein